MASQIASRSSICLPNGRDINGNIVPSAMKKHDSRSLEECTQRKPLRKRRSSLSLDVGLPKCEKEVFAEFPSKRGRSSSVDQEPCSAEVVQSPVTAIGNFIANVLITQHRPLSCSSSSSSSSSESEAEEEKIRPIHVCEEEATRIYPARVQHPTTNERWKVAKLSKDEPIMVSHGEGRYALYAWNLGGGNYVFGFKGSGSTFYVQAPSGDSGYLTLTTEGGDPADTNIPSSDPRCFYYQLSNARGHYVLSTSRNTSSYVYLRNGYAATSTTNVISWDVSKN